MNKRNYLTFAAWAGGSFLSTLILMVPARLNAVGPEDRQTTAPPQTGAVDYVIQLPGEGASSAMGGRRVTLAANSQLTFELLASNTESRSVQQPVTIVVMSADPVSPFSRGMPMMREAWRSSETISLAPRERTRLTFSPRTTFRPGSTITVQILVNNRPVQQLALSVEGNPANNAPAVLVRPVNVTPLPTPPSVAAVNGLIIPAGTPLTFGTPSSSPASAAPTTRSSASAGNVTVLPAATILRFD